MEISRSASWPEDTIQAARHISVRAASTSVAMSASMCAIA